MTDRKKPGLAFWAAVGLVVVLVGYPLSYGVFGWFWWRDMVPHSMEPALSWFYHPFTWAMLHGPEPLASAVKWYAGLWH